MADSKTKDALRDGCKKATGKTVTVNRKQLVEAGVKIEGKGNSKEWVTVSRTELLGLLG